MSHTSQRFCLRWNNHQSNLLSVFDQLLQDESFVDVTLAVEGKLLKAHKMVLSACSPYFQVLFVNHPEKHPIVILKDVTFADMRCLLDFMYRGEVSVDQDRLTAFLKVAESLRIKGLTEVNDDKCDLPSIANSLLSNNHKQQERSSPPPPAASAPPPPPPPNLHRIHTTHSPSPTPSSNLKRPTNQSPSNFNHNNPFSAQGPPDLLEVNMTEQSQNSPSDSISEDPMEETMSGELSDECIKTEPGDENTLETYQDCKSPIMKENSSSRSQSLTPTHVSEQYQPDACGWKDIVRRLKKPSMSISMENDKYISTITTTTAAAVDNEDIIMENCNKGANNNNKTGTKNYQPLPDQGNNSEIHSNTKSGDWYTDGSSAQYYMDTEVEGDGDIEEMDDDDDVIVKYEYEASKGTSKAPTGGGAVSSNNSSPGTAAGRSNSSALTTNSSGTHGSSSEASSSKPMDKSSVRRYCVQVAEHLFQCTMCYKTYTHISNFSRHFLSAHHGLRQEIPCPVCYRIFTRRDNMLTHMKQVHRISVTRGSSSSLIQKLTTSKTAANTPDKDSIATGVVNTNENSVGSS